MPHTAEGKVSVIAADIREGEPVTEVGIQVSSSLRRTIVLCVGLLSAGGALGGVQNYGARLDQAQWVTDSSRLQCSLSQHIPLYGTVHFQQTAGSGLGFSVQVLRQPLRAGIAQLASVAPEWMHDVPSVDLGQVTVTTGMVPVRLDQPLARRLLTELEKGMYPTLTYRDWDAGQDQVTVRISSLNVRKALGEFLDCVNGLLPYDFSTVKSTDVYFAFGSTSISQAAAADLDRVATYLVADPSVREVRLEGFADSVGYRRYNERLSRRRGEAVRDYLQAKGVNGPKFVIASFGERRPAVSNHNARGRAENRRVVVRLIR